MVAIERLTDLGLTLIALINIIIKKMYGSGSGGDWGSVSASDLEMTKRQFAEEAAAEAAA